MKKFTYLLTYLLTVIILQSCNEPNIEINSNLQEQIVKIGEGAILNEGVIAIETKTAFLDLYNVVKEQGAESFYLNNIKNLENFKPLRPFFTEGEDEKFKAFLKRKYERQALNTNLYKNKTVSKSNSDYDIELDDDVIVDNSFAVLLNEDREIIVDGKLYKYREDGVFVLEESSIPVFREYLEDSPTSNSFHTDSDFGFIEQDYLTTIGDESHNTSGGGYGSPVVVPDFYEAKLNFPSREFSKNPSLWGQAFGYSVKEYVVVPDDRRVKLKFWNRNYLLFSTIGTEIRFQKKVSFLWGLVTGWQKSYPSEIAMGFNSLEYNYKVDSNTFINSNMVYPKLYSFGGYDYFTNGRISQTPPPIVYFPLAKKLGVNNGLRLSIDLPFTDFDYDINLSPKDYAKLINRTGAQLLKTGVKAFPKSLGFKPDEDNSLIITKFYRNNTTIAIHNKNFREVNENNITQDLALEIPKITVTADIGVSGESYFSNVNIKPKFSASTFKTGTIDFYGGVLYKNKWYGVRMISTDYKK